MGKVEGMNLRNGGVSSLKSGKFLAPLKANTHSFFSITVFL